jgi:hypothetical protein
MRTFTMAIATLSVLAMTCGCKGPAEAPAKSAAPKAETPKAEAPKPATPKTEAPKVEAPKTEAPKTEAPKPVVPKTEAPKTEAPKTEAPKPVAPVAPLAGEVVLEVESFTLKNATVKDLAGASGGKAVLFDKAEESSATKEVQLKAGKYEAVVYVQAADEDTDAFYLTVGGEESRLFPEEYGKVLPAKAVAFEVKADGAVKLELKASEEAGMLLDRVVIKPAK